MTVAGETDYFKYSLINSTNAHNILQNTA